MIRTYATPRAFKAALECVGPPSSLQYALSLDSSSPSAPLTPAGSPSPAAGPLPSNGAAPNVGAPR